MIAGLPIFGNFIGAKFVVWRVVVRLVDALQADKEAVLVNQATLQERSDTFVLPQTDAANSAFAGVPHF